MAGFWTSETMRERLAGEGLIDPLDADRIVNGAYELSLGPEVYVTSEQTETKRLVEVDQQVIIPPGQFANLLTEEVVTVPADALGLISVKFRLKQRGLVNVSGFHVDPGYSARLLFSVYNAGPSGVVVARGEPAFLLWYAAFDKPTEDLYRGQRSGGITSEDVMHLQGEIATPQALATRVQSVDDRLNRRVQSVEDRLNRWASVFEVVWKAAIGVAVAVILAWLIALAAGVFDDDDSPSRPTDPTSMSLTSTTRTPTPTTTAAPETTSVRA